MTTTELKAKIATAAMLALADYANEQDLEVAGTYIYGDELNKTLSYNLPLPHIYCLPIDIIKTSRIIEWPDITFFFLDQDTMDSSPEQMDSIKNRMERLADLFRTNLIEDSDEFDDDIPFPLKHVTRSELGVLSGYYCIINLKSVVGC
ncbi:hypothetical protein [Adhaeribacter aquaticus]|uniref:hypothetical protein n=1 Tax=Adhaeribacter aquaticus TaxID=299567 RepID=UPI000402410A|nr:hypothetical protein [Adhaeribacter aquaticus]